MIALCGVSGQYDMRFTVKAGTSVAEVLSDEEIYRYPSFMDGHVMYKNGSFINSRLNYNIVLGEMQFINGKGDTMVIANSADIYRVVFDTGTFYVNEGYLEVLVGDSNIMLLAKNYVKLMDVRNQGAYGTSNSSGAVDNYTSISAGNNTSTMNLKVSQDMVYTFTSDYFFKSGNSEFIPARRNSILRLYPDTENEIKSFIKENNVNFSDVNDLIKLTGFLMNIYAIGK